MDAQMNNPQVQRRQARGFSMVEMLIALLFTGFLMAGMAKVFKSSVMTYTAVNETMGAQRTNRWALDQISDDISQAGFLFPERALPNFVLAATEPLFAVTPAVAVANVTRVSDVNPTATQTETVTTDILEFFTDIPLPVTGSWNVATVGNDANPGGAPTAAPTSVVISLTQGAATDLRNGDVMIILDSGETGKWEHPVIASATGGSGGTATIALQTDLVQLANYTSTPINGGIALSHVGGVPVFFVRPAQLVRYSVQAVALDPSNSAVKLPCLIRQQASYPTAGTVTWTSATTQIVAENVEGFVVDLSFDGGATWARPTTGTLSWAAMQANANTQLNTAGLPGLKSITDSANPDWYRNINCLIRVDITTRAPIRREEYSATAGARAYRTRTQTLMISPRNFGYGK